MQESPSRSIAPDSQVTMGYLEGQLLHSELKHA